MFKHSKVLNLSPQIRQGGDENKVSYKNFKKLASNLASRTGRHVEQQMFAKADEGGSLGDVLILVFGFHQVRARFCKGKGGTKKIHLSPTNPENSHLDTQAADEPVRRLDKTSKEKYYKHFR